jgi:hypothetical protein
VCVLVGLWFLFFIVLMCFVCFSCQNYLRDACVGHLYVQRWGLCTAAGHPYALAVQQFKPLCCVMSSVWKKYFSVKITKKISCLTRGAHPTKVQSRCCVVWGSVEPPLVLALAVLHRLV